MKPQIYSVHHPVEQLLLQTVTLQVLLLPCLLEHGICSLNVVSQSLFLRRGGGVFRVRVAATYFPFLTEE